MLPTMSLRPRRVLLENAVDQERPHGVNIMSGQFSGQLLGSGLKHGDGIHGEVNESRKDADLNVVDIIRGAPAVQHLADHAFASDHIVERFAQAS